MVTETRYFDIVSQTVNGLTAKRLMTDYTEANQSHTAGTSETLVTGHWAIDVFVRHADGTQDQIGTKVAEATWSLAGHVYRIGHWTPPETVLVATDAIVVDVYGKVDDGSWVLQEEFVTNQLGANLLSAVEWSVYYNVYIRSVPPLYQYLYYVNIDLNPDLVDLIDNFQYTLPTVAAQSAGDGLTFTS